MERSKMQTLSLVACLCLAATFVSVPAAMAEDFSAWLANLRREAAQQGISGQTLEETLDGLRPLPEVLEFQSRQPELELSFVDYRQRMISRERIATARRLLRDHRQILAQVSRRYGVPPSILTALWAMESDFGRRAGRYPVLRSLATLAYEGRRRSFFRRELLAALAIVDSGWVRPAELVGSWAGAMGVFQFIPSTMRHYAVDHDGDGRPELFANGPDAFASAANYLKQVGWRSGEPWGIAIVLPEALAAEGEAETRQWRSPDAWHELGVAQAQGLACPEAGLLVPEEGGEPAFLVCRNFKNLLRWNRSTWFALTVGHLADSIEEEGTVEKP